MRPIAVGRKGYLFVTCRLHQINPYHWLKDVLERMADYTTRNLHELLPGTGKLPKCLVSVTPHIQLSAFISYSGLADGLLSDQSR